jgi:hypothetical protein
VDPASAVAVLDQRKQINHILMKSML